MRPRIRRPQTRTCRATGLRRRPDRPTPHVSERATAVADNETGTWTVWYNGSAGYPLYAAPLGDHASMTAFMYDLLEARPEDVTDLLIEIEWAASGAGDFRPGVVAYGRDGQETDLVVTSMSGQGEPMAASTTLDGAGRLVLDFPADE